MGNTSKGYINVRIEEIRKAILTMAKERGATLTEICGYQGVNVGTLTSCKAVYANWAKNNGLEPNDELGRVNPLDHARLQQILGDMDQYTIKEDLPKKQPEPEAQDPTDIQLESYKLLKEIAYYTKTIAEALQ